MVVLSALVAAVTAAAAPPVAVIFFGESECPYCREFMGGTVNSTLSTRHPFPAF